MIAGYNKVKLGLNIDHVATIRNARGGVHPDPIKAATIALNSNMVDGITAHLREDRRHISDEDIIRLKKEITLPLNLEMAATDEMVKIALNTCPDFVCIVPEKRQEVTTEGGLDIAKCKNKLTDYIKEFKAKNIKTSLFIEPNFKQIDLAKSVGADIVEIHTGKYANLTGTKQSDELSKIILAAEYASKIDVICNAGHGLNYDNVYNIAKIKYINELNIGHFLIGESIFVGLGEVISKMRNIIDVARADNNNLSSS